MGLNISDQVDDNIRNLTYKVGQIHVHENFNIKFPLTRVVKHFLEPVLKGNLSIGEVIDVAKDNHSIEPEILLKELKDFLKSVSHHDIFLLRRKGIKNIDVMRDAPLFS